MIRKGHLVATAEEIVIERRECQGGRIIIYLGNARDNQVVKCFLSNVARQVSLP
jgi:hypothetical protein